jgi:hypothetical protein
MLALLFVALSCLGIGLGAGFLWGRQHAVGQWRADVHKLEAAIEVQAKELRDAQLLGELLQAVREGNLSVADLQEIGLERLSSSTALVPASAPTAAEKQAYKYANFHPLLYQREVGSLQKMIWGDEVWVALGDLYHLATGTPVFWAGTECSPVATPHRRARVRVVEDSSYELAIDPTDPIPAGGTLDCSGELEMAERAPPSGEAQLLVMGSVTTLQPEDRFISESAQTALDAEFSRKSTRK